MTELTREETELAIEDIADVIELLSASVAVERTDEKEDSWLEASSVRELTMEEASDMIDDSRSPVGEVSGLVLVVGSMPMRVVVGSIWAMVMETKPAKRRVQRMLNGEMALDLEVV